MQKEIETLQNQEDTLQFETFDHDLAYQIGAALREEAVRRGVAVTIDVRAWGQILFHCSMGGTTPDNDSWVERKSAVVLRFHASSFRVGRELAAAKTTMEERYLVDSREFGPHGGSFPIRVRNAGSDAVRGGVIGAITVSGLPQEEDHALVVAVLERFTAGR